MKTLSMKKFEDGCAKFAQTETVWEHRVPGESAGGRFGSVCDQLGNAGKCRGRRISLTMFFNFWSLLHG
jgi:hypothetical protein